MKKLSSALAVMAVLGFSVQANAAGYQLTEYSTTGLGRSFAGAGLVGDDYSAIAYNPAGMSYTTRSGAQLGFSTVGIRSTAKGTAGTTSGKESPYIVRVLPHGFAQYRLNDRTVLGLGIYTPFGLATDYKNGWFGKTHAGRSEIQTVNVSPALSVNVTESVALGASVNLQHSRADLTSEVESHGVYLGGKAHLRGHDTSLGYTLGATWEPVKNKTRLGVSYRSKVVHDLKGKNTVSDTNTNSQYLGIPVGALNMTNNIHTKITTPETVTLSAWQRLTDKWSVSATARWTRWSQFKDLNIYYDEPHPVTHSTVASATHEHWRNTWFYSLGADYQYCKNLIFRFGGAYDQSVVKGPEYRTARIPDGRRIWTSLGFSYMKNNWQLDGGYAHLFVKDVKARHKSEGMSDFDAKYSSNANLFSLAVQYKF